MLEQSAPPGLVTSLRWHPAAEVYSCSVRYQVTMPNGLPLLLVGTVYSRTRVGALSHALELVARQLLALHLDERRRPR